MKKLYVVGIGPGSSGGMTIRAAEALREAQVIAGYGVYNELIRPIYPDKEYIETPMRREQERCKMAIESALNGRTTAMICSGDAGVYGMASLIFEMAEGEEELDIEVVPGVTAAMSGAALLGAPLSHDFAVISLSDALTPWEKIEKRLTAAAEAGMCIALYNPASRKRPDYLKRACDILIRTLPASTWCGAAVNIGRENEHSSVMTLSQLRDYPADMFTTVFIGNGDTRVIDGKLVTPRGYHMEGTK